ncbi:uncharacterized protein LOC100678163 [Nasonia vitripennis]|uniref:Uncharacterized protein n=1 Tax=Nasonia vitripennis TaxID=7425 RepID=A0A7M7QL00_NASVI|nr:uncharacterized protein LOC100678163 [Nasonia vitripennis]
MNFLKNREKLAIDSTSNHSKKAVDNTYNNVSVVISKLPNEVNNMKRPSDLFDSKKDCASQENEDFSEQNSLLQQRTESSLKGIETSVIIMKPNNSKKVIRALFTENTLASPKNAALKNKNTEFETDDDLLNEELNLSPSIISRCSSSAIKRKKINQKQSVTSPENTGSRKKNTVSQSDSSDSDLSPSMIGGRSSSAMKLKKVMNSTIIANEKNNESETSFISSDRENNLNKLDKVADNHKKSNENVNENTHDGTFGDEGHNGNGDVGVITVLIMEIVILVATDLMQIIILLLKIIVTVLLMMKDIMEMVILVLFMMAMVTMLMEDVCRTNVNNNRNNDLVGELGLDNLADPAPDNTSDSDISSEDEGYTFDEMQNDPEWGYIRMYKYKLFKYLRKQPARSADGIFRQNIRVGSLSWKMFKNQKDDLFLRAMGLTIWTKRELSNRCLELGKVSNTFPARSPVKTVTLRNLNHVLRIYIDHLSRNYEEDRIRFYMKKSTRTLSYHIRDLRRKCIKRARQQARRAAREARRAVRSRENQRENAN